MKLLYLLSLIILMAGMSGYKKPKDKIVINGEITGKIREKVEYTLPIHGVCNWCFTQSVQADSLGKFQISIVSGKPIFLKMKTSGNIQGTMIAEPGETYEIRFDPDNKANNFSVAGPGAVLQEAYNKLPHPEHIQIGAREFMRDSVAGKIKETIEQRRKAEIAVFEKLLSEKVISQKVFNLVQTDRNCYYDAVLATTAFIKDLMTLQGRGNHFTLEFENLWKDTFKHPLFSDPEMVNSPWFNFYAESYIYFREFVNGNFTKEKLEAQRESKLTKTYRVNKAKEYLPVKVRENYLANYLYEESMQKQYEKELISLFDDYKADYPESRYIPYISPFIDEITEFHKTAESGFSKMTKFVENYQHLNSLTEIANTFPKGRIYVDVWATWCGPCKAEFEYREELKKLLQKNNIQILYISVDREEDSIQWKNMIKFYNLEGYHVQVNKELGAELRKIFDSNGSIAIPWYILMDNTGNIIRKHASPPSRISDVEKEIHDM
jgi:thiol-disulfide isomerase/thioredoxin